ncbi:hypothetical protein SDC9_137851 [bioreactor metagenome]|uniref:Polysaccharide pyruvyl transferase domain-containing protein n=1 Tax=bioreactor metagenome TaxID=1076179 RepID=A0A645DN81_9ZZZZ
MYRNYALTPVFLPVEPRRDVAAAQKVASRLSCPYRLLDDTGTSAQTIGLLSRMAVVVSMRLHGLVFAAGQGVPLVGVVYDQKVSAFLDYIGQDLYLDLDTLSASSLMERVEKACARIGDTEFLSKSVLRLRQVEGKNSETAKKLLGLDSVPGNEKD